VSNPLSSQYGSEQDSPGFMLWRVTNRWQAVIRAALRPFGLTHVQFVLLAALTWAQRELTQIELAHQTRADPMMTSQVLRALEGKGLVERREHPADGRARLLRVTPAGADLARRANVAVEAADQAFFGTQATLPRSLVQHLAALDKRDDKRDGERHDERDSDRSGEPGPAS